MEICLPKGGFLIGHGDGVWIEGPVGSTCIVTVCKGDGFLNKYGIIK